MVHIAQSRSEAVQRELALLNHRDRCWKFLGSGASDQCRELMAGLCQRLFRVLEVGLTLVPELDQPPGREVLGRDLDQGSGDLLHHGRRSRDLHGRVG